jgi:hypothetical protein
MERNDLPLKPLASYWTPPRPVRLLVVPLVAAVGLLLASMRLPWHHHVVPAAGYTVIYGIQGASWLLVVAALCTIWAIRFWILPPGWWARWLLTIMTVLLGIGMFADYVDAQTRASQLYVQAYFGPGFYVGLAGTGFVVIANVLLWFNRE